MQAPPATTPVHPRGPAASHPSSLSPSNPYNFPSALLAAAKQAPVITDDYVFFFGYEDPSSPDSPNPHICFQQWFPCEFDAAVWSAASPAALAGNTTAPQARGEVKTFGSTEQFMMHAKALLFNDQETAGKILAAEHPSVAKQLGRQVKNFEQEAWNAYCDTIVEEGNYAKFSDSRNTDLREVLVNTGSRRIVETSPDDKIWGIGFDTEEARERLRAGKGEEGWGGNGLGRALMRVRDRLKKEDGETT